MASLTIVTYDCQNIFIVQATGGSMCSSCVLQLLFKNRYKNCHNSTTVRVRERVSIELKVVHLFNIFMDFQGFIHYILTKVSQASQGK
jgi:hypothetical protein